MIQPTNTQSFPRISQFLSRVDLVSDALGLSVPQIVKIEALRSLPKDTLGRTLADFLTQHQLKPFTSGPRRKQLHDGVHVLAGYDTDLIGEAEVQAFLVGCKFQLMNVLIGLGIIRIVFKKVGINPDVASQLWERMKRAYQLGYNSRFDPDTWEIEKQWEMSLAEVRSLYKINI